MKFKKKSYCSTAVATKPQTLLLITVGEQLKHSETSSVKHLYIQEVTLHVAHKAASVLQTCLRKSERPKGLKTLITTQAGGGEATSLVWGCTGCLKYILSIGDFFIKRPKHWDASA